MTRKEDKAQYRQRLFSQVPMDLVDWIASTDMDHSSRFILMVVAGLANLADKDCFATNEFLADKTKYQIRQVQKAISELKRCPLVKIWYTNAGKQRHIHVYQYSMQMGADPVDNSEDHASRCMVPCITVHGDHASRCTHRQIDQNERRDLKENKQRKSPSAPVLEPRLNLVEKPSKNPAEFKNSKIDPDFQNPHPPESILKGVEDPKAVFPTRLVLPPHLDTPEGRISAEEWRQFRKSKRKPVSEQAWAKAIKSFHTVEQFIETVDTAIASDWQGLFVKPNQNLTKGSTQNGYRKMTTAERGVEETRKIFEARGILKPRERAVN